MTEIGELPIPEAVIQHYQEHGVSTLYPPQAEAIDAGLLAGQDIVAAVPTASGKTLIAELAMVAAEGISLYVVPLRALAHEKAGAFAALPGIDVAVATGDVTSDVDAIGEADIVVATSEKVNAILRTGPAWIEEVECVVIDEFHLLGDEDRGPTLEMTVATLRHRHPSLQIVALSATVANAEQLASWLDAALVDIDWRPVELHRGIAYNGRVVFDAGDEHRLSSSDEAEVTTGLVAEALTEDGQCLVFVHSRRAAETLAAELATAGITAGAGVATDIRVSAQTRTGRELADVVANGVAFHHAGLRHTHRTLIEDAFRDGSLDTICATPTLAAGVNLPARRVVVRDHRRYTGDGWDPLPVLDVHQMFGRAGRPGLDPYGEAILVAEHAEEARGLEDRYLRGTPEAVRSSLATQDALRTHVLGAVAGGFATNRTELLSVLAETFYAYEADEGTLVDIADLVLDDLATNGFLERENGLAVTALGRTVAEQFIDPHTGTTFVDALDRFTAVSAVTRRTVLEVACNTCAVEGFYLREDDHGDTHQYARRHNREFVTEPTELAMEYAEWLTSVKTVRVLVGYLDGDSEAVLTERHGIGPGDLRVTAERVSWLLGALAAIAELREHPHVDQIRSVRDGLDDRLR